MKQETENLKVKIVSCHEKDGYKATKIMSKQKGGIKNGSSLVLREEHKSKK